MYVCVCVGVYVCVRVCEGISLHVKVCVYVKGSCGAYECVQRVREA
jgi:hypothetical protein